MGLMFLNTAMVGVAAGGIMAFMPVFIALGASSTMVAGFTSAPARSCRVPDSGAIIAERQTDQVRCACAGHQSFCWVTCCARWRHSWCPSITCRCAGGVVALQGSSRGGHNTR